MSADADRVDVRELLRMEPSEVVRQHRDRALEWARRAREEGKPEVAEAIEARVQLVEEGSL